MFQCSGCVSKRGFVMVHRCCLSPCPEVFLRHVMSRSVVAMSCPDLFLSPCHVQKCVWLCLRRVRVLLCGSCCQRDSSATWAMGPPTRMTFLWIQQPCGCWVSFFCQTFLIVVMVNCFDGGSHARFTKGSIPSLIIVREVVCFNCCVVCLRVAS